MTGSRQDSIDRHVERWRDELDFLDPVHEAVVARLMILSRHLAGTRDAAHADAALPRPSFKILLALRRLGAPYTASPSELADHLGLSRARCPRGSARSRTRGWSPGRWTRTTGAGCTSGSQRPAGAPSTGTPASRAGSRPRCSARSHPPTSAGWPTCCASWCSSWRASC